jgi:PAS domain S-box-containing protein
MSWTTALSASVAAACLTLAVVHLGIWWKDRAALANLGFSLLGVGVAWFAWCELAMLRAPTPGQFATALRWTEASVFVMVVGTLTFVGFYLRTARAWIGHLAWGLRLLTLVVNFTRPSSVNYDTITRLQPVRLLGETVFIAEGVLSVWHWVGQISLALVLIFVVDASWRLWRVGSAHEKHRALTIGLTTSVFVLVGAGSAALIFAGALPLPHLEFVPFLPVLCAMSYELSRDVLRAAQLSRELQASEAALRESERRMTMAADAARLGMWIWDIRSSHLWITDKCRDVFGFPPDAVVDYEAFVRRLHPDDRTAQEALIRRAIEAGAPIRTEYRLVLPDGSLRWIAAHGRVDTDGTGRAIRMLGVCIDISERRTAELEARELGGRLINAQEDERRRIARDLHDDLNQRLALISVQLELLEEGRTKPELGVSVERLAAQVRELSTGVHKLSYQLHPAKLDQLGLVTAARSWCRDLAESGLQVEFAAGDVPDDLPADVALCLFRVIQEALRNVARHSGAATARVVLTADAAGMRLVVSDRGRGFDPPTKVGGHGLGLVSMQERVRLLHGAITFESSPDCGTIVTVTIPVSVPSGVGVAAPGDGASSTVSATR